MDPPSKKLIYGSLVALALGIVGCIDGVKRLYNSVPECQQQPCSPEVHQGLRLSLRDIVAQQETNSGVSGLIYSGSQEFPKPPPATLPDLPDSYREDIIIAR